MSRAIEEINRHERVRNLMNVASDSQDFLKRYSELMPDDRRRDEFQRELMYLIHLVYREAQEPLVQQLRDFVVHYQRPLIIEKT